MPHDQHHLSLPKYRPDIDGLRAIAVLSVVVFHAFPGWINGGFVGVDIFFVISGYLIASIIFENLDKGTFSFSEFYARRIKRIFPALLLVLFASYAFGWFALLSDEYQQLGKHIAGGAGFVSNLLFWNESGYFDNAAETKPLLHLWSLGIEEQFYILWPLVLWLAWKKSWNPLIVTISVGGLSFYLNVKGVKGDSVATFYSPQTRFWELLAGNVLAWLSLHKREVLGKVAPRPDGWFASTWGRRQIGLNALSFIGLLLLVFGFWRIHKNFSFPGVWPLIPVAGAVLIIFAGPMAWVNRKILSNKILVWFGLISYPLYLWHWPLLSFARIIESEVPALTIRVGAVVLATLLAWLTYRFVERPIRAGQTPRTITLVILCLAMVSIGAIGYRTYILDGLPTRSALIQIGENQKQLQRLTEDDAEGHQKCLDKYQITRFVRYCNVTGKHPTIALIGDSHARAMYDGMSLLLANTEDGVLNIGGRLLQNVIAYPKGNEFELKVSQGGHFAAQFVADEPSIKTVVLLSGERPATKEADESTVYQLIDHPEITDRKKVWEIGLRTTLDGLTRAGKNVIFMIDYPEVDFDPKICLENRPIKITRQTKRCAISRASFDAEDRKSREMILAVLQDYPTVKVFDSAAYLCDKDWCMAKQEGKVLYRDEVHLSVAGSLLLAKELIKVIGGGASRRLVEPEPIHRS
jgi:peptidoglycan/LPS O-acetylase OafA/YrhL